ncbi:hypothetical protein [Streptomyces sp. 5-10]|uniref:hypothetical protein n=1 Tax=Streptomyces sp. 5-10 TaxID=878925 RepID=UPI00168AEE43|nr:hypothetical protein [Streptomyces sp. 5-10]MBD3003462.1 hypothetical protein [Streptomyces sp. 5-10]
MPDPETGPAAPQGVQAADDHITPAEPSEPAEPRTSARVSERMVEKLDEDPS